LELFLTAPTSESLSTTAGKKEAVKSEQPSGGKGLFGLIGSSVESLSTIASSYISGVADPDQWFETKRIYVTNLEKQLTILLKAVSSVIQKQRELDVAFNELSVASGWLATAEQENSQWISNSFHQLSSISSQIVSLDQSLVDTETAFFEDSLRDYVRIIGAVKEMLNQRSESLYHYQNATKQLEKLKQATKIKERDLEEAEKKVEETKSDFLGISDSCKSELQRFEATKMIDFKRMLIRLTQANINFGLQVVDQWKVFLSNDLSSDPESAKKKEIL